MIAMPTDERWRDHLGSGAADGYFGASTTDFLPDDEPPNTLERMNRHELAARIAASEARTDTKFAALTGRIDLLVNEVQGARGEIRSARTTYVVTAIGSVLAIGGLIIGLLAYGGDQFGRGFEATQVVDQRIDQKLDQLYELVNRLITDRQAPSPPNAP